MFTPVLRTLHLPHLTACIGVKEKGILPVSNSGDLKGILGG